MAETATSPNNKPVSFGRKVATAAAPSADDEMAAMEKPAIRGPTGPRTPREPSGAAKSASIRKKAKGAINKGMISEKAAKKFLSNV